MCWWNKKKGKQKKQKNRKTAAVFCVSSHQSLHQHQPHQHQHNTSPNPTPNPTIQTWSFSFLHTTCNEKSPRWNTTWDHSLNLQYQEIKCELTLIIHFLPWRDLKIQPWTDLQKFHRYSFYLLYDRIRTIVYTSSVNS